MKKYPKIQTAYLRDPETKFKTLLEGQWSKPEFEYLKDKDWYWTEKIDGTNIRIQWHKKFVMFGGRTDNAQLPGHLITKLIELFPPEKMAKIFPDTEVCLYGEGYGKKIQKGGNYIPDGTDFILFDVLIGNYWLKMDDVEDLAQQLGIKSVPVLNVAPLTDAIEYVKEGFTSTIAHNPQYLAEGLILKPTVQLFNRTGERVITKIKHNDFK